MLEPQSRDDLAPFLESLKRLDPLLDVLWKPNAIRVTPGRFNANGQRVDATYEGRWQIIRHDTPNLHKERTYAVIVTVTEPKYITTNGMRIPILTADGPYAPLGEWLIDYLHLCDRAQGRLAEEYAKIIDREHERAEALEDARAEHQEGAEKIYRRFAGTYWMGGAQGRAHPETEKALWPAK